MFKFKTKTIRFIINMTYLNLVTIKLTNKWEQMLTCILRFPVLFDREGTGIDGGGGGSEARE